MIRVVLRHVLEADSILLGDFPPSEVRPLLDLLDQTRIVVNDEWDDVMMFMDQPMQLVQGGRGMSRRYVLELLVE